MRSEHKDVNNLYTTYPDIKSAIADILTMSATIVAIGSDALTLCNSAAAAALSGLTLRPERACYSCNLNNLGFSKITTMV